jgi:pimeloyl-ACP methyl ester carboxylesterase
MRTARKLVFRAVLVVVSLLALLAAAAAGYDAAVPFHTAPTTELWQGRTVELDGRRVAYRRWGTSGSPIVLIPGFAESTWVFEQVAPILARRHRVFALDLAGFGYTERTGPYGLDAWTAQVRAFLHRFRLERPLLVGHSLGAAVAVSVAAKQPVGGVVLADGDGLRGGGPPRLVRRLLVEPYRMAAYRIVLRSDWLVRRILLSAYGPLHPEITHAELDRWREPFHVDGAEGALWAIAQQGIAGFSLAELRRLQVRALVLWGGDDGVDPISSGRRAAAALGARVVVLPGAGHLSMLEQPQQFAGAVGAFAR